MIKKLTKERIEFLFLKIEKNPEKISFALKNLENFKNNKTMHPKYLSMWESILLLPINEIKELMLEDSDSGELLRTTSIFFNIP